MMLQPKNYKVPDKFLISYLTFTSSYLIALETGIERDNATYQLALVHRAQDQPELSVPLLIQIITSQSPTSGLGKKAYEQLLEIGFVDAPLSPPKPRPTEPQTEPQTPAAPSPNSQPTAPEAQPAIPNP